MSLDLLLDVVRGFAEPVGFRLIADVDKTDARIWRSPYALLALWPVPESIEERLEVAHAEGEAWMEKQLRAAEAAGEVLDGYLVLCLPKPPPDSMWHLVAQIEQDPRFCRKHIVWVGEHLMSERILRVTSIGLPPSLVATGPAPYPELTKEEERIVEVALSQRTIQDALSATLNDLGFEGNGQTT